MDLLVPPLPSVLIAAWGWSVGLGAAIGVLYILISLLANRAALRKGQRTFMMIVVGGMLARMTVTLGAVVLILLLMPVQQTAFIGAFAGVFVIGTILEVLHLRRITTIDQPSQQA